MLAYVVRHAESRSNTGEDSGLDSELTDLGRLQAEALAGRFGDLSIDALYSSPFRRSLQTARPIADALGIPVRLRPELFEAHHLPPGSAPDFELPGADAIAGRHECAIVDPDSAAPVRWPALDESREELMRRMGSFAQTIRHRWDDPNAVILIISHGSPIARLIDAWLGDDRPRSFRYLIDNGAVTALRCHDDVSSLVCLNESSHLRGLPAPASANFDDSGRIKPVSSSQYW